MKQNRMEWNETEQNGTDGMEWSRMEGNGTEGQALCAMEEKGGKEKGSREGGGKVMVLLKADLLTQQFSNFVKYQNHVEDC